MVKATKTTRTMVDPDLNIEKAVDLGFVGDPEKVDLTLLNQLIGYEAIALAPLATSQDGQKANINAGTFAGAIAGALKAKRLLLLTDVPGVLDKSKRPQLSIKDARKLIADGTISGGIDLKVETRTMRWNRACRASSSSMARCGTQSCWNCSPIRAPARHRQVMARAARQIRAVMAGHDERAASSSWRSALSRLTMALPAAAISFFFFIRRRRWPT